MADATLYGGVLGVFVAFVDDHKRCGDLEGGLDDGYVWLACSCAAQIVHPAAAPAPAREA
jgi:hypothetical protein